MLRNRTRGCLGGGGGVEGVGSSKSLATPEVSSGSCSTSLRSTGRSSGSGQMRRASDLQRQHIIILTTPQVTAMPVKHTIHADQHVQPEFSS